MRIWNASILPVLVAVTATNTDMIFHLDRCNVFLTNYTSKRLVFLKLCFTCNSSLNRSGVGVVEKRGGYRKNKPKQRPTNILTKKPFASTTRDVYELYHNVYTKAFKKLPLCKKGKIYANKQERCELLHSLFVILVIFAAR